MKRVKALVLIATLLLLSFRPSEWIPATVVQVVDGDTIRVVLENGKMEKVRLIGIDAPESWENRRLWKQVRRLHKDKEEIKRLGWASKRFLQSLIPPGSKVFLELDVQQRDRYGRLLAYVRTARQLRPYPLGDLVNYIMVREGYAMILTIPPNVRYAKYFVEAQRLARQEGKGLWAE